MKICYITDFFVPHYHGGGEIRLYEIGKRLVKKGHCVDILCMKIKGVKNNERIEGINVIHLGPVIKKPPFRSVMDFIKFILATYDYLKKNKYDIVDAQPFDCFIPAYLSYKHGYQKNVVATIHDASREKKREQWIQYGNLAFYLENFLYRLKFKKIITVSNEMKKILCRDYGINSSRIEVIFNGVDGEAIDKVPNQKIEQDSIIFVGRLIPHKHVDHLIEIVPAIIKKFPRFKLKIVGEGPELKKLKKMSLGLENNIRFLGKKNNYKEVIKEIKKSEILVLPSTREGFGLVLAEANACSRPVVAYASGGVKDVVKNGYNGYLVEENDREKLKEKIIFLLTNKKKAKEMGMNGRKRVDELFRWEMTVKKIEELYKSVQK